METLNLCESKIYSIILFFSEKGDRVYLSVNSHCVLSQEIP